MLLRCWTVLLSCLAIATLSGCGGGYVIEGKAIRGEFTSLSFVRASDSRLNSPGVSNVELSLYRNPDTLGRSLVARGMTDDQGNIYIPVNVIGIGWTIEQWLIHSYRPGMKSASTFTNLPSQRKNMMLLLTLGPGIAKRAPEADEAYQQYKKFK